MTTYSGDLCDPKDSTSLLRDAFLQVEERLSYLKVHLGPLDQEAVTSGDLAREGDGPSWLLCQELIEDRELLGCVLARCALIQGTNNQVVAASIFVQGYAYRILALSLAAFTFGGVMPGSKPTETGVLLGRGRVSKVAYLSPRVIFFAKDISTIPHGLDQRDMGDDWLRLLIDDTIEGHLRALIESVRSKVKIGERLLWGNVAASAATAFRTMEGCLGPWIIPMAERFFEIAPKDLMGQGCFILMEHEDKRGWFWERNNCCLYDRLDGGIRCSDCSMTDATKRRADYAKFLSADGD